MIRDGDISIRDDGADRECPVCGRDRVCSEEEAMTVYRGATETARAVESYLRSGKDVMTVCTWCLSVTYLYQSGTIGRGPPRRAYYRGDGDSDWGPWHPDAKDGDYPDVDDLPERR